MRRPDHHNEVELNFLEKGTLTYLFGGRKIRVDAGRLTVFWAAIPHQIIAFGRDTSYFVATVPLPWFLQWRLPDHFVQLLLQGSMLSSPGTKRWSLDAALFRCWTDDLISEVVELENAVLLEMHARLLRLALELPRQGRSTNQRLERVRLSDAGLNKVEQMACFIAQRYTERLTVQEISAHVRLHPNYAMNLFHRSFGTTLIDYLTQHRISHAQRLLVTSDAKVADIAFDSGFCSISRFNDAFRRACGCSPREYRMTHRFTDLVHRKHT